MTGKIIIKTKGDKLMRENSEFIIKQTERIGEQVGFKDNKKKGGKK